MNAYIKTCFYLYRNYSRISNKRHESVYAFSMYLFEFINRLLKAEFVILE